MTKLDIGAYGDLQTLIPHQAITAAGGTVNGTAVNLVTVGGSDQRKVPRSLVIHGHNSVVSGSPSSGNATVIVEQSADGSTGWTTLADITGSTSGFTIAYNMTDNTDTAQVVYNLDPSQRYIRVTVSEDFDAGGRNLSVVGFIYYGGAV